MRLGHSRAAVSRRVRDGALERVLPRVYRIAGTAASVEQRAIAALLWAGADAVVSHATAGYLWGLPLDGSRVVHLTTPTQRTRPPPCIVAHTAIVPKRDCGTFRGVRVTNPVRTVVDLAACLPEEPLFRVVESAVLDGLVTAQQLRGALASRRGQRGSRMLRSVLDAGGADASALDRRVDAILRGSGLPPYRREFPVGPFRLDFAWPDRLVAVEPDGRRWHSSRRDFARDRAKHNALVAAGWRVLRVTPDDVDRPRPFVCAVSGLLLSWAPRANRSRPDLEVGQ